MTQEHDESPLPSPSERIDDVENGEFTVTYHWVDQENRHTFLYFTFVKKSLADGDVYLVQCNIDSSEVKGQGKKLWNFINDTLKRISRSGIADKKALPIMHEYHPNAYSLPLVQDDERYVTKNGVYYAFFLNGEMVRKN